jgi:outer membrane autotransporter protein
MSSLDRLKSGVAGTVLVVSLFAASGAQAQNCVLGPSPTVNVTVGGLPPFPRQISNLAFIGSSPAGVSSMISSVLTTADTAFLLQSTAFIGSPANPTPGQEGGGIWVRGVGGEISQKSSTSTTISASPGSVNILGIPVQVSGASASVACSQKVDETFAGIQFGSDIARLNINGWNIHLGATAGFLQSNGSLAGGAFEATNPATGLPSGGGPFSNSTQVPFVGGYAAATYNGFFIDGLVRAQFFQTSLNAPASNIFNQQIDAQGLSFSGSIGYNWQIPNSNWFIEPSAGVIISRTKVDPFNYATAGPPNFMFNGTLQINEVNSDIGRAGLRFGTTINSGFLVWQPFAAVSVWHEFGPSITSNYTTCNATTGGPGCVFFLGLIPVTDTAASSTSNFGTFGQYSLGVSAQLAGTGWLGFARVDFRDGPNLEGWSGTGGIRYQYTPEVAGVMPIAVKGPVKPPVVAPVSWTGFYGGGFGGAFLGTADWDFAGGGVRPHIGGYDFGGDIGYRYQMGLWVVGVEGDLSGTNLKGGTACGPLLAGSANPITPEGPMFQMTCKASASWIATATAQIGYAWDRTLFYAKGGSAWTEEHFSATCNLVVQVPTQQCVNPAGAPSTGFNASANSTGWTIGGGIEFALTTNWSARAEYNFISFGDRNVTASDGSILKVGMNLSEVKIGVNYRFNAGPIGY